MDSAFRLSVAIPVDNEESVLPELLRRTCTALDQVPGGRHEIVFVHDGTTARRSRYWKRRRVVIHAL